MSSSIARSAAAAGTLLVLGGCAAPAPGPGMRPLAKQLQLAPYASERECMPLHEGERLDYRFESSEPVAFDVQYREGVALVMPIVRDGAREDAGIYPVPLSREFCLVWEAGARGARLEYRWRILGDAP